LRQSAGLPADQGGKRFCILRSPQEGVAEKEGKQPKRTRKKVRPEGRL